MSLVLLYRFVSGKDAIILSLKDLPYAQFRGWNMLISYTGL